MSPLSLLQSTATTEELSTSSCIMWFVRSWGGRGGGLERGWEGLGKGLGNGCLSDPGGGGGLGKGLGGVRKGG